jgi:hypothetical protein
MLSIKQLLVSVYQVCSNKGPGVKIGPTLAGVIDFPYVYIYLTKLTPVIVFSINYDMINANIENLCCVKFNHIFNIS